MFQESSWHLEDFDYELTDKVTWCAVNQHTSTTEDIYGSTVILSAGIRGPYPARHLGGMVLWASILFLQGAGFAGSMTSGIPGVPENITVMFLNPTSVRVSWSTSQVEQVEKYDVTYKPTDASYRVVAVVAGNSEAVTLSGLRADTQYQLVVTAVRAGKKYRSRPIVFRTLEPPRTFPQQDAAVTNGPLPPSPPSSQQPQAYIQIRGVEVGIVILVLIVWAGAIALFFNRWGKIRMLLPYQPDYKEQLKVPGTGVCTATNTAYPQHSTQHTCSQFLLSIIVIDIRASDYESCLTTFIVRENSHPKCDGCLIMLKLIILLRTCFRNNSS
ncbi:hypothetical protein V1477_001580 [Vespula maculifrons]|uniref:Fibronectin type-III domain-containing protein n=1 Tax=Vespula maculifrons TaxID=7453 RepID=A0ABD2CY64_VESMC